ncbi:MAG: LysM peptidoglycan-binding domain-containing protein [Pseudomonadota bacterium]
MRLAFSRAVCALCLALAATPEAADAQARIACGADYVVVRGDTLFVIAERAYGPSRLGDLYEVNRDRIGPNPDRLDVGDRLRVPCLDDGGGVGFEQAPEITVEEPVRPAPGGQPVEIVFNKASAPGFILNVGIVDPLFDDIERATEGRVRFIETTSPNRDPEAQMALVASGAVDGAYMFNGYLADTHPLVQITMHPMMGGTALQTAMALWRAHDRHFEAAGEFDDVHLLGFVGAPPAHIWRVSDEPVDEREELSGNNAWTVPYFEGLDTRGARAVRSENAERIRLLDETPGLPPATYALAHGAARAVGVWTNARTVTEIDGGVYAPTFSVFISREKWDAIAPADRLAIERLSGEALALRSAAWDAFDNGHKAEMLRQGLNIVQPDLALLSELQDRARANWEVWIETADASGVDGYAAIQFFFDEIDRLRSQYPAQTQF